MSTIPKINDLLTVLIEYFIKMFSSILDAVGPTLSSAMDPHMHV